MAACRCRKATRVYCFIHQVPVCGECICFPEHQLCVTGLNKNVFGNHFVTVPKADAGAFASDPLKRLSGSGESNGANTVNFSKDATLSSVGLSKENKRPAGMYSSGTPSHVEPKRGEIDGPNPITTRLQEQEPNFIRSPSPHGPGATTRKGANYVERQSSEISSPHGPGATTRKGANYVERQSSEMSCYADDEDANRKKYSKRGTFRHKFLRMLLPFWSTALPMLPVTAPLKNENDAPEGRSRHQRSSRINPTKILLAVAIMTCIATMGILYYRLSSFW